jgi:hypothetical protein
MYICIVTMDFFMFFVIIKNYVIQFVDVSLSPCCDGIFAGWAEGVQKDPQPQPIPPTIGSG